MRLRYILLTYLLFMGLSLGAQQKKTEKTTITNPSGAGVEYPYALEYDYILIDCPAGLGQGFRLATCGADRAVVVSVSDPSSLRDAQPGQSFQFMRLGYFCPDSKDSAPGHLVFNRSVSLKDSFKPGK